VDINAREDEAWFDNLLKNISEHRKQDIATIEARAHSIIARADSIRYVQLGNPETILIDDGGTQKRIEEAFAAVEKAEATASEQAQTP
jgi:hypothetical protein